MGELRAPRKLLKMHKIKNRLLVTPITQQQALETMVKPKKQNLAPRVKWQTKLKNIKKYIYNTKRVIILKKHKIKLKIK